MGKPLSAAAIRDAAPLFAALGDPTRLEVVRRLIAKGPQSTSRLSEGARVSRQAVTKHLEILTDARLVESSRSGRERIWHLESARLEDAHDYLDRIGAQWDAALDRLRNFLDED